MVSDEQLIEHWKAAVLAQNTSRRVTAEFNALLATALAERLVPPDHSIDFLGDGKIKPESVCRRTLKEPQ